MTQDRLLLLLAAVVPVATRKRFPLSTLLYVLILGGAYTYARLPLGFWPQPTQ